MNSGQQDPSNIIFHGKLNGAFARLFAAGCTKYLEEASPPEELPVWCGLSPQQRIRLAAEVMVGLLCEDEPLDNIQTEQHFVAYMSIWKMIDRELSMELDSEGFYEEEALVAIQNSCPPNHVIDFGGREEEKEGIEELLRKETIRSKIASKQKGKLNQKVSQGADISGEEEENTSNLDRNLSEVKGLVISFQQHIHRDSRVFTGGPPPRSSRTYLRPEEYDDNGELDDMYGTFRWRLMCDEAFQEQDRPSTLYPTPLRDLNFNWKLNDVSQNSKWHDATYILFLQTGVINYGAVASRLLPLHYGEMSNKFYANPNNHQRILSLNRTIQEWRAPFDEAFDETQYFLDQRCIFSLCSNEIWGSESHQNWLKKFITRCRKQNFCIHRIPGNYQKRLDVYRSLEN
ncbi:unnamed protein product, partial [Heterosigma akashiwo]